MTPERRLRVGTAAILIAGFVAAIVIYATASPPAANPFGYEPEDTKKYLRDLEVYGGKANVVASRFRKWFDGLWHGKQLALTVVVLTVVTAGTFAFFAAPLPPEEDEEPERRDGPRGLL